MKSFITFLLIFLCFPLITWAQDIETEDADDETEEVEEDTTSIQLSVPMSWEGGLRARLDSLLSRHRTTTVWVRKRIRRHHYKRVKKVITLRDRIGISLYDLTADSLLFSHNATESYTPASNQKLFVAITALDNLGDDYPFTTDINVRGEILKDSMERSYLKGDILIHGRFDPTLDKAATAYLASKVGLIDADSIDGRVFCYEPLKPRVTDLDWFWRSHASKWMSGELVNDIREDSLVFSTPSPAGLLTEPQDSVGMLYGSISTPLSVVLQRMMKNSDNGYAESVLMNLCCPDSLDSWTYEACRQKVRDMVRRAGSRAEDFVIDDGSGLSHANKTTPTIVTDILRYAYGKSQIYQPLLQSLPIAGVDGTLRRRMAGSPAYRKVFGKTGTVNGVSTLSGYLTASNGHQLAFSILMNNISSNASAHTFQDILCKEICR